MTTLRLIFAVVALLAWASSIALFMVGDIGVGEVPGFFASIACVLWARVLWSPILVPGEEPDPEVPPEAQPELNRSWWDS